jgi:lysozyme family protein
MGDFACCIDHILEEEGGYVHNPEDPGGETKYGISKRAYPHKDIAALTVEDAKDLYYRDYWSPVKGDDLPAGLDLLVFDSAINQGVTTSVRLLQKATKVNDDGVIGPVTLAAAAQSRKLDLLIKYAAERAFRYATTPNKEKFGRGWFIRLFRLFFVATRLADIK